MSMNVTCGITLDEYENMYQTQNGACKICSKEFKRGVSANVDHDHDTGEVRGLLCFNCNTGIGKLEDSAVTCLNAAIYLVSVEESKTEYSKLKEVIDQLTAIIKEKYSDNQGNLRSLPFLCFHA